VAVSGSYAYVADGYAGFLVLDVSNPAKPQRIGGCDTTAWASAVSVSGNYAYVAVGDAGLQVIDVRNPAKPKRVGGNVNASSASGVFATATHVFVAAGSQGLMVLHPFTPLSGPALSFAPLRMEQSVMRLSLQGLPGLRVEIDRSADLAIWQKWTNGVLGTTPLEFGDPAPNASQFYRLRAP
jgi:hypothetical protein